MKAKYIYMNIIAPSFNLLPIIIALVKYHLLDKQAKILLAYLVINMLINTAASVLAYHHLPNTPLFHVTTIIETMLLLYFFMQVIQKEKVNRYLKAAILIFPVLGFINALYFQHLYEFNSYILSLQSVTVIVLCFLYWWLHESDTGVPWTDIPLNWITSGLLLYFSSAFILFTFSNFIIPLSSKSTLILIWNIHATLTILMYVFISTGYSKYKK